MLWEATLALDGRRRRTKPVLRALSAACAIVLLSLTAATAAAAVPTPDQDPFYQVPNPIPAGPPGTVIKSRTVSIVALVTPVPFQAWQVMFVSNDANDQRVVDTATIIEPLSAPLTTPRPLVSYQMAEDGLALTCSPSYEMQVGTEKEEVSLPPLLAQGWAVVVPDYEGLNSQYTAAIQAAHGVLDGIRAAETFPPAGLSSATPVGLWGYSGGALASSWASEFAPTYAPELNILGVAEGGVPADITHIARNIDGGPFSSIEFAGTVGMSRAYPQILLNNGQDVLNAQGKVMFATIGKECIDGANSYLTQYPFQRFDMYTTVPNAIGLPAAQQVLTLNKLGSRRPNGPLYMYQAVNDELIPVADVNAVVTIYCNEGVTVDYYQDVASDHNSLAVSGAPAALAYLAARFAGIASLNTCGLPLLLPAPPSLPEAPVDTLLPLTGLGVMGAAALWMRRKRRSESIPET